MRVFVGIGSNLGDRATTIKFACDELCGFLDHFELASLYETRPRDVIDQPPFLNTVAGGTTSLSASNLLARLQEIERRLGRDRSRERPKGPRPIDLDLLLCGQEVIESEALVLPHPRMTERKFVLVPLTEIAPTARHPATGIAFQTYLESLAPQGIYYFQATRYSRDNSGQRYR